MVASITPPAPAGGNAVDPGCNNETHASAAQVVALRDSEGHLTRKLIERLFTSLGRANAAGMSTPDSTDSLLDCWRMVRTYQLNAAQAGRIGAGMQLVIFWMSVGVTCASRPERPPGSARCLVCFLISFCGR